LFLDYCFLSCTLQRLEDPSMLIKAGWIRPEDIGFYETMGFEHFKLQERGIPSAELLKRVKAYGGRRFTGNLAELILPYGFKQPPDKPRLWLLRHFFRPGQVNPLKLRPLHPDEKPGCSCPGAQSLSHRCLEDPADFIEDSSRGCSRWRTRTAATARISPTTP
jgi:hypothetical protein